MEKIFQSFLLRIKQTVDKSWPDEINSIEAARQNAEREAQGRQRRQRYIDYALKSLRSRCPQQKAQEYLMENSNATWNEVSTRTIQWDVSIQISSNFLNDEEQSKAPMTYYTGTRIQKTTFATTLKIELTP